MSVFLAKFNYKESYLSFNEPGIGKMLVFSVVQFFFYNLILFLLEFRASFDWRLFNFWKKKDYDIKDEKVNLKINLENLIGSMFITNFSL